MSLPLPVDGFWVSTVTLPASREGEQWCGHWFIYSQRPDLEENADALPLFEGSTGPYDDERDAERAAKMAGRRRAQAMAT